ncbi:MAG: DUF1015 family protein, partial [Clostridia bacterium]|nr:DUF1015 family protein [Clostridia bacterium]
IHKPTTFVWGDADELRTSANALDVIQSSIESIYTGGIRGLGELEKRCREDMVIAFSMYPTSLDELMAIADAGEVMPPKSTWFEPKLLSGLFIHKLK